MSDTGSSEPLVLVSCPKGQVEKYVNVEACISCRAHANIPNTRTEKIDRVFIVIYCVISKCFKLSTKKQCYLCI